jgi:hypothetical protein
MADAHSPTDATRKLFAEWIAVGVHLLPRLNRIQAEMSWNLHAGSSVVLLEAAKYSAK